MTSISPSFPSSSNHSYASALFSSSASLSPILQHKKPQPKKSHIPSSSWADQVDEARNNNNSKQNGNKKQKLNQIMNWSTKPKPNNKSRPHLLPRNTNNTNKSAHNNNISNTNISSHQHKDGEKQIDLVWALAQQVEDEERKREALVAHLDKDGKEEVEGERDNREKDTCSDSFSLVSDSHSSCDSYSTVSGDSMSCDTASSISCESEEKDKKKKKKKKNKKRKRKFNAADEGKKVFVGGITFEDCGSFLSKDNETLAALRQKKFSEIFYLFGSVYRIQGHWESGYCFVVYNKRRDAKLAIKCLSMAKVRRKVVQNLRDNIAPTGVLPLPSFYVRWANNPTKPSSSSSSSSDPTPSISEDVKEKESEEVEEKEMDGEDEKGQMDWVHTLKEEDLVEEDVERLMRELLKLNGDSI